MWALPNERRTGWSADVLACRSTVSNSRWPVSGAPEVLCRPMMRSCSSRLRGPTTRCACGYGERPCTAAAHPGWSWSARRQPRCGWSAARVFGFEVVGAVLEAHQIAGRCLLGAGGRRPPEAELHPADGRQAAARDGPGCARHGMPPGVVGAGLDAQVAAAWARTRRSSEVGKIDQRRRTAATSSPARSSNRLGPKPKVTLRFAAPRPPLHRCRRRRQCAFGDAGHGLALRHGRALAGPGWQQVAQVVGCAFEVQRRKNQTILGRRGDARLMRRCRTAPWPPAAAMPWHSCETAMERPGWCHRPPGRRLPRRVRPSAAEAGVLAARRGGSRVPVARGRPAVPAAGAAWASNAAARARTADPRQVDQPSQRLDQRRPGLDAEHPVNTAAWIEPGAPARSG